MSVLCLKILAMVMETNLQFFPSCRARNKSDARTALLARAASLSLLSYLLLNYIIHYFLLLWGEQPARRIYSGVPARYERGCSPLIGLKKVYRLDL